MRLLQRSLIGSPSMEVQRSLICWIFAREPRSINTSKKPNRNAMQPPRKPASLKLSASDFSARSPMNLGIRSSRSFLALQRLKAGESTEHQLRAIEMIERQTRHQSFLIEDLLDLNRREIGKIELRRSLVDLRECVQHAAETNQAEVDLKSLDVQLELPADPIYAHVDRERLCQIANNLMSNAVKFTPKDGTIVWRLFEEPGWQVMSIRDSGVGIKSGRPPAHLRYIFPGRSACKRSPRWTRHRTSGGQESGRTARRDDRSS